MTRRLRLSISGTMIASVLAFAASASANSLVVTTTADEFAAPGSGCALREALAAANDGMAFPECGAGSPGPGPSGKDTITFAASAFPLGAPKETIDLAPFDGAVPVTKDVDIIGPGIGELEVTNTNAPTLGGRIFDISSPATVAISGLEITSGGVTASGEVSGVGIRTSGDLTLDDVRVANNTVVSTIGSGGTGLPHAFGGGIDVTTPGSLNLTDSIVESNQAIATSNSAVDAGTQVEGGGIRANGSILNIDRSTIAGNTVTETTNGGAVTGGAYGGGIEARGPLTLKRSAVTSNTASSSSSGLTSIAGGGGAHYASPTGTGLIELTTVAGNGVAHVGSSLQGGGGGISSEAPAATLDLIGSTVADNDEDKGGAQLHRQAGTVTVSNTIVADPRAGLGNCEGTFVSGGFNIDYTPGIENCGFAASTDLTLDPLLIYPLSGNGGSTANLLPGPGSPAIDQGSDSQQITNGDQRGLPRPANFEPISGDPDDGTDIGAVEVQTGPITFTGTTPASPSSDDTPQIRGTLPAVPEIANENPQVQLYTVPGCSSGAIGSPTAAATFAGPGITVGPLAHNATTTFHGKLSTDYGTSPCSVDSISYTHADPPPTPGVGTGGGAGTGAGSNAFSFGELRRNKKKGTAIQVVNVPGPGQLELAGKGVKPRSETGTGAVELLVKASGQKQRKLRRTGKAKLTIEVTFTPNGGAAATQSKNLKLKRKS